MPTKAATSTTTNRRDGPSSSRRNPAPPTLSRLPTSEAASTLQSSAVAAIGSIRTLASISSTATSLHQIPAQRRAIKVVLIGDGGTGKTSLRNRFLTNTFYPSYRATIGADFITKSLPLDPLNPDGEKATLQIWDTAGQERFQSLGSAFYRGADAVVIAIDASKGEEEVERVRNWYDAFMLKGPGPEDEGERRRFCWICVANKSDLLEEGEGKSLKRSLVRGVLDGLVGRKEGQIDWGIDPGQEGERPSGAEEPANPAEVLSRPDPNAIPPEEGTPTRPEGTPSTLHRNAGNGDASPTPARKNSAKDYRLSRKSLSSIAAAAKKGSDAEEFTGTSKANGNGTVNTMYVTPYNTISNLPQLSSSPTAKSDLNTPKQDTATTLTASSSNAAGGSGFLSSWRRSKASSSSQVNGRGYTKRQSIKSIEVFHLSDHESASEAEEGGDRKFAFPSSSASTARTPPPKSTKSSVGGARKSERERVDSTMSLGAPSVYHTPRSSTIFSASPTPRTILGLPSVGRDDASIRGGLNHGRNQLGASSLRIDGLPSPALALSPEEGRSGKVGLKHKPSLAPSSAGSVATLKPAPPPPLTSSRSNSTQNDPQLRAPKSINDLFQPQPHFSPASPPLPSPAPPQTPSTISLPPAPLPPPHNPDPTAAELEEGFSLFYTSAKTGHNVHRLFSHILHRVTALQAYQEASRLAAQDEGQREERERSQAELIRRTIRLASGKNPDRDRWFGCC